MDHSSRSSSCGQQKEKFESLEWLNIFPLVHFLLLLIINFRLSRRGMITMTLQPPQSERHKIKVDFEEKISIQDNVLNSSI